MPCCSAEPVKTSSAKHMRIEKAMDPSSIGEVYGQLSGPPKGSEILAHGLCRVYKGYTRLLFKGPHYVTTLRFMSER